MKQLTTLFKDNKFFRLAVIFGSLFFLLTLVLSPKKSSQLTASPPPIEGATETHNRPELQGLPDNKLKSAADYRSLISDRLPIRLENFATSVGINTTINIYYLPSDPASVLRFEIYGVSYINKDSTPLTNPNIIAFQESFKKGLSLMENVGIDPKQVIFIYSDIEYIRNTAQAWVNEYSLLP